MEVFHGREKMLRKVGKMRQMVHSNTGGSRRGNGGVLYNEKFQVIPRLVYCLVKWLEHMWTNMYESCHIKPSSRAP